MPLCTIGMDDEEREKRLGTTRGDSLRGSKMDQDDGSDGDRPASIGPAKEEQRTTPLKGGEPSPAFIDMTEHESWKTAILSSMLSRGLKEGKGVVLSQ